MKTSEEMFTALFVSCRTLTRSTLCTLKLSHAHTHMYIDAHPDEHDIRLAHTHGRDTH